MHRKITSDGVEGYASHIPKEEVELVKDEDLVFKKGLLTQASGTTSVKLMPKVRLYVFVVQLYVRDTYSSVKFKIAHPEVYSNTALTTPSAHVQEGYCSCLCLSSLSPLEHLFILKILSHTGTEVKEFVGCHFL